MKVLPLAFLALSDIVSFAQITLDVPLRFTGNEEQRGLEGLAAPTDGTSAITVGTAVSGAAHWATASEQADTLLLTLAIQTGPPSEGALLRFLAPKDRSGATWIKLSGDRSLPLVRPDGLDPITGELTMGAVCEILLVQGKAHLLAPHVRGCPPNSVPVNARYCIQRGRVSGVDHMQASEVCRARGGRLCTWDEYYVACSLTGNQLNGLFSDWEWIDDTSDHSHTGNQMARTNCTGIRSVMPSSVNSVRCCYDQR